MSSADDTRFGPFTNKVIHALNLLIYLNQTWQESWGGQLELWSKEGTRAMRSVLPTFNRAVIFDTSNKSYHGHPHPLACPDPYQDDLTPHSTLFIPS